MKSSVKIRVFVADKIHIDGLNFLSKHFKLYTKYGLNNFKLIDFISQNRTTDSICDVLVIRSTRRLDSNSIEKLKSQTSVKAICTVSSGFDNIDISAAKRNKIKVFNVPWGNYISAAEHTFAMLLAITKRLEKMHNEIKLRIFNTLPGQTTELHNKTIGIIGVGRVGSYVARLARSFGMRVLGNDIKKSLKNKYKWIKFVSLSNLLKNSNYITIHTPLDNTTRHLINRYNIKQINKNSIILNCARGGVIDENALYNALRGNKISYAGIDVFENEPDIDFKISKLRNVLLTPHIAGKTAESYRRMAVQASEILIKNFIPLKSIEIHQKIQ